MNEETYHLLEEYKEELSKPLTKNYKIVYKGETVDDTTDFAEACHLLTEYNLAFGGDVEIVIE